MSARKNGKYQRALGRSVFLFASIFLWTVMTVMPVEAQEEYNACIACHEFMGGDVGKPVTEWMGSTHQSMGILCTYCHGGDESLEGDRLEDLTPVEIRDLSNKAMYDQEDFISEPDPLQMFEMCGQCHDDAVSIYRESIMGKAYIERKGGPSCTRCHGAHRNFMPDVPEICEDCHKDLLGFDQIESMNVTPATIDRLYEIRLRQASAKITGGGETIFPEELDAFEIGFVTWGMVLFLVIVAVILYRTMER
jgi:hypothetical protein